MLARIGIVFGIGVAGLLTAGLQVQEPATAQKETSEFMQRKLDFVRSVVDGLATEDFEKISNGAQDLLVLSHEAEWNTVTSARYIELSSEFRLSCDRLRTESTKKNLDGATLAYFEVTLNCIRCHKQVREGFALDPEKRK